MPDNPQNAREFTRVTVNFRVDLYGGGWSLIGAQVLNLSMKGMLVKTEQPIPVGTACEVVISLVEREVEIRARGSVAAIYPVGTAFVFTALDGLDSYEHLRNLILFNTTDLAQVEMELDAHAGIRRRAVD